MPTAVTRGCFPHIPFGFAERGDPGALADQGDDGSTLRDTGCLLAWRELFSPRQLLAWTFVKLTRAVREAMLAEGIPDEWAEAVASAYLGDRGRSARSDLFEFTICIGITEAKKSRNTFGRFAFPIIWDFAEVSAVVANVGWLHWCSRMDRAC